jgi:type II secretory pathway pseudopilin PulG
MGRAFGLISIVVSLALVGIVWATSMQSTGPTSASTKQAREDAAVAVSSLNFNAAATELEAFHAQNGTYAGATLSPSFGVTLVRADAATYCVQAGIDTAVTHFDGPNGATVSGPC